MSTLTGTSDADSADGPANQAQSRFTADVVVPADGTVYVADKANNHIRFGIRSGEVVTLVGTGE